MSNQPCSARSVRKQDEENTTCEQMKSLAAYLKSKKMLINGHSVIPDCAGTDITYLKM
jgi:hypothetical protein